MVTCSVCGRSVQENLVFCPDCGERIGAVPPAAVPPAPSGVAMSSPAALGPLTCSVCGAPIAVPADPSVLQLRCGYCGAERPVPDFAQRVEAARRRAASEERRVAELAQNAAVRRSVRRSLRAGSIISWLGGAVGLAAVLVFVVWPLLKTLGLVGSSWSGNEPFVCTGNDDTYVSDVTAHLRGTAIQATGNCRLKVKNCRIRADTAIEASGNASVTLLGGSIEGAIDISGNASVSNASAEAHVTIERSSNGRSSGFGPAPGQEPTPR